MPSTSNSNGFRTFKKRFPNMVSVLNDIIASEKSDGNHQKLEAIYKMVVSRDKKISGELIAADYFVETLRKIGVTKQMVLQLEKDMPKIISKVKLNRIESASTNQTGGGTHRLLSIWVIIILLIVQYLLTQIILSPDDLARIQNDITMDMNRIQELNRNCTLGPPPPPPPRQAFDYTTNHERPMSQIECQRNYNHINAYNATLQLVTSGVFNRGVSAYDIQFGLFLPGLSSIFRNMPMMTIIVGIICLTNVGAALFIARTRNTRYYDQHDVANMLNAHYNANPQIANANAAPRTPFDTLIVGPLDVDPDADNDAPDEFKDLTFTMTIMRNPVVAQDGRTYERASIARWLLEHNTSPATGADMPSKTLISNISLRRQIVDWKQRKTAAAAAAAAAATNIQRFVRRKITNKRQGGRICRRDRRQPKQTKRRNN